MLRTTFRSQVLREEEPRAGPPAPLNQPNLPALKVPRGRLTQNTTYVHIELSAAARPDYFFFKEIRIMDTPVVLITGALTGIGRATAIAFARQGARIVVSGRRDEVGQKLLAELRETRVEAEYWRTDVRHDQDVRDLVDKTVARF